MVDENTHLISACQLAGFRHVIGTLWKVDDGLCVDMTRTKCEAIRDGGMNDGSVARSLRDATRELRRRWLDMSVRKSSSERDVSLVGNKTEIRSRSGRDQRGDGGLLRDFEVSDDEDGAEGERSLQWVP